MKLTIPNLCHENWNEMLLDERGKFCSVCSKTVKDFTECTDEEVYNDLKANHNICGRFTDHQIKNNIGFSVLSKIAIGFLISGALPALANAQELKGDEVKKVDFKKGLDGFHLVNDTINRTMWLGMPSKEDIESTQPWVFLDKIRISESKMKRLNPENIESVNILDERTAIALYGHNAKYGVILITSKKRKK